MNELALECRQLWKVFGKEAEATLKKNHGKQSGEDDHEVAKALSETVTSQGGIIACQNVDLSIRHGEFFVLMGLSGSGKSTLIRCLSRLTEPSAGKLLLDGEDFLAVSGSELRNIRRSKLGMVFQHFGLFPHMTVLDNVAFPLRVQKFSRSKRTKTAMEMIELVGLQGRETAYPDELSGGQKQRVGIARSLAVDPSLWFLDEPFSALDPLIRSQMQTELQQLQARFRKTIVFVTHDFMEAVKLADRIAIMKDGRVEQIGTPQEILLHPATDYVAEFVQEAPRTRIIKVESLMQAPTGEVELGDGPVLTTDMTLEDVLASGASEGRTWQVRGESGELVGLVPPEKIAAALASDSIEP